MASHSQANVDCVPANSDRRITEGIRRAIAALQPDLMWAVSVGEAHPIIPRQFQPAIRTDIGHDLGARKTPGIELLIPCRVERVYPINPLAVTADFNHLRPAAKRLAVGMRRAPRDPADMHGAGQLRLGGVADRALPHLSGSP